MGLVDNNTQNVDDTAALQCLLSEETKDLLTVAISHRYFSHLRVVGVCDGYYVDEEDLSAIITTNARQCTHQRISDTGVSESEADAIKCLIRSPPVLKTQDEELHLL